MNHFKKIAGVLEAHGLDAVLLTCGKGSKECWLL